MWNFDVMLTPKLIRFVYRIVLVGIVVAGVIAIIAQRSTGDSNLLVSGVTVLAIPVVGMLWRIVCEQGLVLFAIHEELQKANSRDHN
jgi:hypothetical protein